MLKDKTNIGYVQAVPLDGGGWEVGYHVGGKFTKNGYATEAVKAFLPVVMKRVGIDKIAGICVAENVASQKVMEKCGFVPDFKGIDNYQGEQREICRYYYMLG